MTTKGQVSQDLINEFVGVAHGDAAHVRALLDEYPGLLNEQAAWGETAIAAAAQTGNVEITEYLLDRGAPMDICTATMLGRRMEVERILAESPGAANAAGAHGLPVLYHAAIRGNLELAALLVAQGAELNAGAGVGTPLHGAATFGQAELARWLLEYGADRTAKDFDGKTPHEAAEANGHLTLAEMLR